MRLALIGVGLIGGSTALAWRQAGLVTDVSGFDVDEAAAQCGRQRGVIDKIAASAGECVRGCDVALVAVPVGAMRATLQALAPALPPRALITDVGSTKRSVIDAARAALDRDMARRFVPGHPIAGRERPGVEHADAQLFRGRLFISTPDADTDPATVERVEELWRAIGAQVVRMDAGEHDRVFAAVSHLPHLLAFALVARIASEPDGARKLSFAGAGFRDFTRIAASSSAMWRDIALANRTALGDELRDYRTLLDDLQRAVDAGDAGALERVFELASRARRAHAGTFDAE